MKRVYVARDDIDAHLARDYLERAGIKAIVHSGALRGVIGAVAGASHSMPAVWVREEDYDAAVEALKRFKLEASEKREGPAWNCPNCGEMIEPQFSHCWNCGHARPEESDESEET